MQAPGLAPSSTLLKTAYKHGGRSCKRPGLQFRLSLQTWEAQEAVAPLHKGHNLQVHWLKELVCRFLAEVPEAFEARVQALLPFLVAVHCSGGVPFLLPALLLLMQPPEARDSHEDDPRQRWLQHLLTTEVDWRGVFKYVPVRLG